MMHLANETGPYLIVDSQHKIRQDLTVFFFKSSSNNIYDWNNSQVMKRFK